MFKILDFTGSTVTDQFCWLALYVTVAGSIEQKKELDRVTAVGGEYELHKNAKTHAKKVLKFLSENNEITFKRPKRNKALSNDDITVTLDNIALAEWYTEKGEVKPPISGLTFHHLLQAVNTAITLKDENKILLSVKRLERELSDEKTVFERSSKLAIFYNSLNHEEKMKLVKWLMNEHYI